MVQLGDLHEQKAMIYEATCFMLFYWMKTSSTSDIYVFVSTELSIPNWIRKGTQPVLFECYANMVRKIWIIESSTDSTTDSTDICVYSDFWTSKNGWLGTVQVFLMIQFTACK